jgi:predicted TIM-barrel fold metal-dependent hydrolase
MHASRPDAGRTPSFKSPPHGCDSHFHVFGPAEKYAYGSDLRYRPPLAPLSEFLELLETFGLERMVFVQPSAYGLDNSCMLDAMAEVGTVRCRGVVDLDETMIGTAELARMDRLGVRGIRVNVSPIKQYEAGFAERMIPRIERLGKLTADLGWHLDFLTPGWLIEELMPTMLKLPVDYTLAHMGIYPAKDGAGQKGFQTFLDFVRNRTDRAWVKLTGAYRISQAPELADVAPMAKALIAAIPDRMIWGSDYPHLSFADKVGSIQLWNLLGTWAPDETSRRKILADNPARLFGF